MILLYLEWAFLKLNPAESEGLGDGGIPLARSGMIKAVLRDNQVGYLIGEAFS